nr:unnamed protein product [Spirometra erinaceieuropaei]
MASVTDNGHVPEAFATNNGVKKGRVLVSSVSSNDLFRILIVYIADGHLLNSQRVQAPNASTHDYSPRPALRRQLRSQHRDRSEYTKE